MAAFILNKDHPFVSAEEEKGGKMSSRALRRLQQDATVIKVSGKGELSSEDEEDDQPGFSNVARKKKSGALNPFSMVSNGMDGRRLL